MHARAHHPNPLPGTDIFGTAGEPHLIGVDLASGPDMTAHQLHCVGTLAHHAEVRTKPTGPQGDPAPVLCLDLQDVVPGFLAVHLEQVFAPAQRHQAEALAARLRKGMRVAAWCPMQAVRLSLTDVQHIDVLPPPPHPQPPRHPKQS